MRRSIGVWHTIDPLDTTRETRRASKQFTGAQAQNGMPPPAASSSERYEDKSAPMELRMGQKQLSGHAIAAGMADNPAAKIKHIQIERLGFQRPSRRRPARRSRRFNNRKSEAGATDPCMPITMFK